MTKRDHAVKASKEGQKKLGAVLKVAVESYRAGWKSAVATMDEHRGEPIADIIESLAGLEGRSSDEEIAKVIEKLRAIAKQQELN